MLEVFVDFDGTITDVDTFDVLVRAVAGDSAWNAIDGPLLAGEITLREALVRQAAALRLTRAETLAFVEAHAHVDPEFGPFVDAVEHHGGKVLVVSSGISTVIHDALKRAGVEVDVLANDVDFSPKGWNMSFVDASDNGHNKAAHVTGGALAPIAHGLHRRRHQRFCGGARSRRTLCQSRSRTSKHIAPRCTCRVSRSRRSKKYANSSFRSVSRLMRTALRNRPTLSISTSITSPFFRNSGGVRA